MTVLVELGAGHFSRLSIWSVSVSLGRRCLKHVIAALRLSVVGNDGVILASPESLISLGDNEAEEGDKEWPGSDDEEEILLCLPLVSWDEEW